MIELIVTCFIILAISLSAWLGTSLTRTNVVTYKSHDGVYVSGYHKGVLTLYNKDQTAFSTTLPHNSGEDSFLAKYDNEGNVKWVTGQSSSSNDVGKSISTDRNGNVYVGGYYTTSLDLYSKNSTTSSAQLTGTGRDGFIAKYDKDGNVVWAAKQGSTPPASANLKSLKISTDRNGNVYIAGEFYGNITFYKKDNTPGISFTGSTYDGFIAKYDKDGNVVWAAKQSGSGTEISYDVSTDRYGNVYIAGDYYTNTPITLYNSDDSTGVTLSSNGDDAFLAKYDSDGNIKWAASQTSTGVEYTVPNSVSSYYYLEEVQ